MNEGVQISSATSGPVTVLSLEGRLDAVSSEVAGKQIDGVIEDGAGKIVIDLSGLEYISSSGLRVMLAALKKVRSRSGDIRLSALKPFVHEVFEISGFSRIFLVFDNADQAVASFSG
jgi:anti-sigma B factor antagonist